MKTKITKLCTILAFCLAFVSFACKTEIPEVATDTTAPSEVANLSAQNLDGAVLLTWNDPTDSDLFGIEITYTSSANTLSRAISTMQEGSIFIAPKTQSATIPNLKNSKTYTFTLKTMDLSGNKSSGKNATITPTAIQGKAMQITLTPSTTEITNQNVDISILITTDATSISTVKYESGNQNTSYFISNGAEISANNNGEYSFTATKNGTYTVYVFDSDGRRETQTVKIENIDKTSPKEVVNLMAVYDYSKKKITVTWDTRDTDIDYYLISYNLGNETKASNVNVPDKSYTLSNIEAGTDAYTFTVKSVDKAGNEGNSNSTSITPKDVVLISSIKLDRNHIAYNDTNKTINVTVYGSNFNLISSQSDQTLKVQFVDGTNITTYDATVNTTNNTATATITVPTLSEATVNGTDYTIRAKVCGTIDTKLEHTATLNISSAATISSISLSTTKLSVDDVTSGDKTTATVTGTNFDVAGTIKLQLYDSTGKTYGSAITVDTSDFEMHQTNFTAQIPIPTVDDKYILIVLFDETAQRERTSLQVYGSPVFTSFKIPKAGISKQDNTLTATVIGKNFTAPNITSASFTVTCSEKISITNDSTVKVLSDSMLSVTLTIPSTPNEYKVIVANESKSLDGTFTVKDYSDYENKIGYIILADGTLVEPSSYTEINTSNPPVAVFAGLNDYGAAVGLGLQRSESEYISWALSNTTAYNTTITDIICTPSNGDLDFDTAGTATFTGDTCGDNNWDVICSVDPAGSADAATNYPAFNWANTYGETYKDYLGGVTEGWYMPSIAELCYVVYRNRSSIEPTLDRINKINKKYATTKFSLELNYWSSSQCSKYKNYTYKLALFRPTAISTKKDDQYSVLVIRAF